MKLKSGNINYNVFFCQFLVILCSKSPKNFIFNAVCPMPSAFGIGLISNAVGMPDAVTSILLSKGSERPHATDYSKRA